MPNTAVKLVHVAVGVICDADQRILIARRADHLHQGGLWEFPGGKVETGETVQEALVRELQEELAIAVAPEGCQPLTEIHHDYGDKAVLLDVWWVRQFSGEPQGAEGQPLQWVAPHTLNDYPFPAANRAIIDAILSA